MSYVKYFSHSRSKGIRQIFSPEEDAYLCSLVNQYGSNCWKFIAKKMPNRTTRQCRERYKNYLSPEIKNGPWTKEEDDLLREKYKEFGPKWAQISTFFNSRSDVNIKNRWASITVKKTSLNLDSENISPIDELHNSNDVQTPAQQNNYNRASNQRIQINLVIGSRPNSQNIINNLSGDTAKGNEDTNIISDSFVDKNVSATNDQLKLQNETRSSNKKESNDNNFDIQSPIQPVSQPFHNTHQDTHLNNRHPVLNLKKHEDLLPPLTSKKHDVDNNAIIDSSHPLFLETLLLADSTKNDDSTLPPSANGLVKTFPNYGGNVW